MNSRFFAKGIALAGLLGSSAASMAGNPITMAAKTTWGGANADGWWAPGEDGVATYLTTDGNQRSLAYNPATGNVLLVNALSVRVLNGVSGASTGLLNVTGISGGDRALNQVGVTSDGQIYGSNLRVNNTATGTYKVYRWANEGAANTTEFNGLVRTGGRLGDSFDVRGSGTSVQIAAGFGSTGSGYAVLTGQTAMTSQDYTVAGTSGGDFRLGMAFYDDDTVVGTQNATLQTPTPGNGYRISTFAGSSAVLDGTMYLADQNERALDFALVNGSLLMATVQTNSNLVRIYDLTPSPTGGTYVPVTSANLTTSFTTNGNATADVAFGAINGNTVCLYVLNTNNGIQAFDVTVVPEPATLAILGAGTLAFIRRRRRN